MREGHPGDGGFLITTVIEQGLLRLFEPTGSGRGSSIELIVRMESMRTGKALGFKRR